MLEPDERHDAEGADGRVPTRCIVLLEDLDVAFTLSTSGDSDDSDDKNSSSRKKMKKDENKRPSVSLSGLFNAPDGVVATERRIIFATTNHPQFSPRLKLGAA